MASIDSTFAPAVTLLCPGASLPEITAAVVHATRELCDRSNVWNRVYPVTVVAGTAEYLVPAPADAEFRRVMSAAFADKPLRVHLTADVTVPDALRSDIPGHAPPSGTPQAAYFVGPDATSVRLYPTPDVDVVAGATFRLSYAPTLGATAFDDALASRWFDAIVCGAAYRLMRTPDKPFTSTRSGEFRGRFEAYVGSATALARGGAVVGSTFVRPRAFA